MTNNQKQIVLLEALSIPTFFISYIIAFFIFIKKNNNISEQFKDYFRIRFYLFLLSILSFFSVMFIDEYYSYALSMLFLVIFNINLSGQIIENFIYSKGSST